MIRRIKKLLHGFGHVAGRFPHLDLSDRLLCFLHGLRDAGLAPRCIFDVGAHKGDWTASALSVFPEARFVLLEPQPALRTEARQSVLAHPQVEWLSVAASNRCGLGRFTLARRADSASLSMPADHPIAVGEIEVSLQTLDHVARQRGLIPDVVKIDAEGHDLRVLDGATSLLGHTEVFFIECAVCCPDFENSLGAVLSRMEREGYVLVGLTSMISSPLTGELWLVEGAFVRCDGPLRARYRRFA